MSTKQKNIFCVHVFYSVKKRSTPKNPTGWVTHFSEKRYYFNPTEEQIEAAIFGGVDNVINYHSYHERGEIDRRLSVKGFYPEIHENSELAYYGDLVAEYDFNERCIIWEK